ncbi:hypothetical protein [Puerhibacterium sp. TATVAM-FAB25]|uniref:hypothetical protein n=1 Tax=Puerhibacterium sp. TATVAM-FAB25 TaxID=3093699 RepID=UPI00397A8503
MGTDRAEHVHQRRRGASAVVLGLAQTGVMVGSIIGAAALLLLLGLLAVRVARRRAGTNS